MAWFGGEITTGIDVSDRKLRLVRLKRKMGTTQLIAFAEVDLPQGVVQNGLVQKSTAFVQALRELPKRSVGVRWSLHEVHVGLPEQLAFLAASKVGNAPKDAAIAQAKKLVPLQDNEMYYDINWSRSSRIIPIAAAKREAVDHLLQQFDEAGYDVIGLHSESEAIVNALLPLPLHKNQPTIIGDLGQARTTLTIFAQGVVYFTTSYPSIFQGNQLLTEALAGALRQTISYAQDHIDSAGTITQIVLCGSGSGIPELDHWLTQSLQIPVAIGNPLERLKENHITKKITQPSQFATAIGLALE